MHVRLDKETFVGALGLVQGVVETKKTLPILSHLLLEATEGGVSLFGTDLDVGLRSFMDAETVKPGAVAMSAKKLYEIGRELPEAPVDLQADAECVVTIRCHRAQFKIKGLPKEEFPALPEVRRDGGIALEKARFRDMIRKTLFAVSSDQTRYTLNGILFQVGKEDARMVATDGHRLALAKVPRGEVKGDGSLEALGRDGILIPKKAMGEVLKVTRDDGGEVQLRFSENQVVIEQGRTVLMARLIEGQFPNYDQVVPQGAGRVAAVDRELLQGALRRTSAILGDRMTPTEIDFHPGKLIVSCKNLDLGEAEEDLEAEYAGERVAIGFNARYLLDFLGAIEAPRVLVRITDPLSPALFQPADDPSYSCVIMPMRL